jgi:hypothetical protein
MQVSFTNDPTTMNFVCLIMFLDPVSLQKWPLLPDLYKWLMIHYILCYMPTTLKFVYCFNSNTPASFNVAHKEPAQHFFPSHYSRSVHTKQNNGD